MCRRERLFLCLFFAVFILIFFIKKFTLREVNYFFFKNFVIIIFYIHLLYTYKK